MFTRLQPLSPIFAILFGEMKSTYPNARAFNDRQSWDFPLEKMGAEGTWEIIVAADTEWHETPFRALPRNPSVSVRVISFSGPARAFLVGWDEGAMEAWGVSMPLFRDSIIAT